MSVRRSSVEFFLRGLPKVSANNIVCFVVSVFVFVLRLSKD